MPRALYWFVAGALLGFGAIGILSLGAPFVLAGLILVVIGATRLGGRGLWAAVVGFGGVPALILLWDVTSAPWACQPSGGGTPRPNVNYYACVDTVVGQLTAYHLLAFGFGVIALLGVLWGLIATTRSSRADEPRIRG